MFTPLAQADDPDLLFLIGVFLHGDQQPERADKFFRRALELEKGDVAHLQGFLPDEKPKLAGEIVVLTPRR